MFKKTIQYVEQGYKSSSDFVQTLESRSRKLTTWKRLLNVAVSFEETKVLSTTRNKIINSN